MAVIGWARSGATWQPSRISEIGFVARPVKQGAVIVGVMRSDIGEERARSLRRFSAMQRRIQHGRGRAEEKAGER